MAYQKKKDDSALKKLKQDIKNNTLERLYVFYGEESYLKEYYCNEIEKLVAAAGFADFNVIRIDGDVLDEYNLNDAIESLPLGTDRKLLVIRDPELSGGSSKLKDSLPEIFSNLPEYICLILYYQAIEYKPDKRLNLYKSIEKNGLAVEFSKASNTELVNWLRRRFAANGKNISAADCDYILFLCGSLMANLITEVDKISAYSQSQAVTKADIDAVASRVLDADVFDLTDCVMAHDYKKGLSILRDLMEAKNEPIAVLAALIRQTQRIYGATLAIKAGKGEKYISELYGFRSSYPSRLLIDAARRTSSDRAAKVLDICCNADIEMKSNIPNPERVLELTVLRMAQAEI